ncbi:rab-GTPase-TBC domain-containing protein [Lineolata rhizophorae]|uniref:Rab-GTPase-TBC domain-containing protein n=1 Tax=Lineolata rhizophorae TaxID=578093 RepID=A0A6A6NWE7_9PEZI|nr:rab-GTPase-TBC domain-containing protein [Lineolata rhizophorae]
MPENLYFRQPATQRMLLDILFVWAKLNPDCGYRQGMHELLAPVLWVVERDAVDPDSLASSSPAGGDGDDALVRDLFDVAFVEHDTFTLFGLVMQNAKAFYESSEPPRGSKSSLKGPSEDNDSPILQRCKRIFGHYLPLVDPALAAHLREIEVLPQIFLMRWIRLLYGREFPFDDTLQLWDLLFAQDPSLDLVDLICVAMLLRIRWSREFLSPSSNHLPSSDLLGRTQYSNSH